MYLKYITACLRFPQAVASHSLLFSLYCQASAFVAFAVGWYDSKYCIDVASEVETTKLLIHHLNWEVVSFMAQFDSISSLWIADNIVSPLSYVYLGLSWLVSTSCLPLLTFCTVTMIWCCAYFADLYFTPTSDVPLLSFSSDPLWNYQSILSFILLIYFYPAVYPFLPFFIFTPRSFLM